MDTSSTDLNQQDVYDAMRQALLDTKEPHTENENETYNAMRDALKDAGLGDGSKKAKAPPIPEGGGTGDNGEAQEEAADGLAGLGERAKHLAERWQKLGGRLNAQLQRIDVRVATPGTGSGAITFPGVNGGPSVTISPPGFMHGIRPILEFVVILGGVIGAIFILRTAFAY